MTTNLIVELPKFERYAVGDCEMLERPLGSWVHIEDISNLISWITDNDDRDVMLAKLKMLEEVL